MLELLAKHREYHKIELTCPACDYLGDIDQSTGICIRCGKAVVICPECFRQIYDNEHKCVFNTRQRAERGVVDSSWASHPKSDHYI